MEFQSTHEHLFVERLGRDNVDRIKKIRLMAFDVDGVLTDGSIIYLDNGTEMKIFDVQDGHGLKLLIRAGIEVAFITGRYCKVTERRAEEIGVRFVYQNAKRKLDAYEDLLGRLGFQDEDIGYVGDDLIDIPVMKRAGWAVAVPNASVYVFPYAHYVTKKPGGRGACREICDIVLQVKGLWREVTARYFD
ncbi:MAG: KdsC family phosphatase [Thermodesulforhabdaceae bacterium]|jgi:3-deoxy-D-manno-octulosonate 8-phosphate phosphatase (KDO 8-P phosphatase)